MDPLDRAQVLLLCDLCQRAAVQSHCELCQINLCKACVGEHLSDSYKRHNIVLYKHRTSTSSYPKCSNHLEKYCELSCEKCDIHVCSSCISSGKHHGHKIKDILRTPRSKKEYLRKDLKEFEQRLYPTYKKIARDLNLEKNKVEKHYKKLLSAVDIQEEDWYRQIKFIVKQQKSDIHEMKRKHLASLNEEEREVENKILQIKLCRFYLINELDSDDALLTSDYIYRNSEFRVLPHKLNILYPNFYPHQINTEQFYQMFGFLSSLSITTEEHGYTMKTLEAASFPPIKPLLDEPELITTIDTGYDCLYSVSCFSDEEIWTCGEDKLIKLYELQGNLLRSIKAKSACDIAVTWKGELVYTDYMKRTVNIVENDQIQEVIRLQGWTPYKIFCTSSGDLLVTMIKDYFEQSKVVRFFQSTEIQTIQFDLDGKPLYSSKHYIKDICENRNLDICVADYEARAVVVVNQIGKLRFKYSGPPSTTKGSFYPRGIATDSQSQILTADCYNNCIHILDQDGQFLRYIDNYVLNDPCGLCVDTIDNLFVAELRGGKVQKIRYLK
ncbi:uncharacterized protein LOC134269213 [Saccostrea cucullata]|uniref:uncharacterized protein LOC134269213 n=1 Tax=Saccostrea cuccullata TaxID=36930 RepID=UPI002ECFAFB9